MIDDSPPLHEILTAKRERIIRRQTRTPFSAMLTLADMQSRPLPSLNEIRDTPLFIGHIALDELYDPVATALRFARIGLDAISLFTDTTIYSKSSEDLLLVSRAMKNLPVITQNYTLNTYNLLEQRANGASGVILDASILSHAELRELTSLSHRLKMTVIIRVNNIHQALQIADIAPHAVCVGEETRYRADYDLPLILELRAYLPPDVRFFPYGAITRFDDLDTLLKLNMDALQISDKLMNTPHRTERLYKTLKYV
jgi:indole-3-glycerol phosphate synthase